MSKAEKLIYLTGKHPLIWANTRAEIETKLSESQLLLCVCGKLATGLHESSCRKFRDKVNGETIKKLEYLIPKK